MIKLGRLSLLCTLTILPSVALADVEMQVVPNNWRIQNYVGSSSQVFFAGTNCPNGVLNFTNMSEGEKSRFWAAVMNAKALMKPIGVFYETASGTCQITSFYIP